MELQVGVKAFLKNKEGKYLLLRRNPEKYKDTGAKWDIIGGRINTGAPLLENLKREVYEETKLDLAKEPELIYAQDIMRGDRHIVRLTYLGEIEGEPVLDEDHTEFGWYSLEEMKNLQDFDEFSLEVIEKGLI